MFAFVKFTPDRAEVDPAVTAAAVVPNKKVDTLVPLISTLGPMMNPRYKT